VIVTGGAGFIGSHLVRNLVGRGHSVLNVDKLTYAGNRESLEDLDDTRYRFLKADVCDAEAMAGAFREHSPDWVIHLAAESHVDRSIDGPDAFIQTNIVGTYVLLQAARNHYGSLSSDRKEGFRFLHVSTDEVYGSLGENGYFTEASHYAPHSPYSASKAASDHLVRAWSSTYGLPTIVSHSSNNYGPFQFPEKLIPVVILKALQGESISVYGTGNHVRDWLYVGDHVEALVAVAEKGLPGETYDIAAGNEMRNIDVVKLVCRILDDVNPRPDGRPYENQIEFVSDRPGHDFRYAIDATKITREIGWSPKVDIAQGFRKTVEWYLDHRAWWQSILETRYNLERLGERI
jgi:dTDP-glucose 4,6-dehydratase